MLKGKNLSILGDSISTYRGISNDRFANSTLFYNDYFRGYADEFPVDKTYWKRVIDALGLELCVNNSYSGALLSGEAECSGVNRAINLSRDDGTIPDIIILFMGTNDFGYEVKPLVFEEDYRRTLNIFKENYPNARVCCVTLLDMYVGAITREEAAEYNKIIEDAVRDMGEGFFVADLFHCALTHEIYRNNTTDGIHPNEYAMGLIAEVIEKAIRDNCN